MSRTHPGLHFYLGWHMVDGNSIRSVVIIESDICPNRAIEIILGEAMLAAV
jgi:hypothetical protein